MNRLRIISLLSALAVLIMACGCGKAEVYNSDSDVSAPPKTSEETVQSEIETLNEVSSEAVVQVPAEPVAVTGITLSTYEVKIAVGESKMPIVTMQPDNATDKGEIWTSSDSGCATVNGYGRIRGVAVGKCTVTVKSASNPNISATVNVEVTEPVAVAVSAPAVVSAPSVEPTYINGILIVNKTYALPQDYNHGIDPTAQAALNEMINAAASQGIKLWMRSGFRSYSTQKTLYQNYCKRDGQAAADTYSARPGHSEHQTGLAFDINKADSSFEGTSEALWLAEHCWDYGFIIRYPAGKQDITGFIYEPWHVRYVGTDVSLQLKNSGQCLEEYLGVNSVYNY